MLQVRMNGLKIKPVSLSLPKDAKLSKPISFRKINTTSHIFKHTISHVPISFKNLSSPIKPINGFLQQQTLRSIQTPYMGINKRVMSTEASTLRKTLTPEQTQLLEREVSVLKTLKSDLENLGASPSDLEYLSKSLKQLEELFLLVIVGEFNSGKSSFLNALLGKKFLKEGVIPTTSKIGVLKYGNQYHSESEGQDKETIAIPVEWLKEISLVDTPGTNAVIRGHQQITEHFVPRSDLVLFVTSVDRAFSESERVFLENIKQWNKKIIVVVSKLDLVETSQELNEILEFVKTNFESLVGLQPKIFTVSSKQALKAKLEAKNATELGQNPLWQASKFGELEDFILKTLSKEERTKLKLENPIGVAEHMLTKYEEVIKTRTELLQSDFATLQNVKDQIAEFKKEMFRDFEFQKDRVDNILLNMKDRGQKFIEQRMQITNMIEMLKSEKIRGDFEREVIGEVSRDIERQVDTLIDWIVSKNSRLWKDVMEYLQTKETLNSYKIMGKITHSFDYSRQGLLNSIGSGSSEVLRGLNKEQEAIRLSGEIRSAIINTAAVEVGAVGLGAIIAASLVDITGILGVGALAATGLAILPYKRASLMKELDDNINTLRDRLKDTLAKHFEHEMDSAITKMETAIEPYTRYVNTEKEKLERAKERFNVLRSDLQSLRMDLGTAFKSNQPF
eukprot:CAMPEP_0168566924 /NCGR_PEP_ID=MMETSP0413-20121227/14701_1 /TAXON_ID=136452 /ORGANISM="Filamoeba nolandi, Strain NC-AS-23-1" /LENGTH=677 /DNA_ID=CAMNT_0008599021 /DNA_START=83 /DNA_END=2116 /DNA_ORIENTATION=-